MDGSPEKDSASTTPAPAGILPIAQYGGRWTERAYLSGDWGGARQRWAEKGIAFRVEWLQVGQGIVSGGRKERWTYTTNIDLYADIDLMRMGLLPGAVLSFRAQSRFGETVNADTGFLLPVNTFSLFPFTTTPDDDVPITVTELNYLQFLSKSVAVQIGKITTMRGTNEFAGGEGRSQFMNLQFLYPGVFAQFVPYSTLAATVLWLPTETVTVTTTLMNMTDASTTTGFTDFDEGTVSVTAASFTYPVRHLPGGVTVSGAYGFNGDFLRLGSVALSQDGEPTGDTESDTWAVFVTAWQYLHLGEHARKVDPTDGRQDLRGLGAFVSVGVGERDVNPAPLNVAVGLAGRGMIHGRPDDSWGAGYFYNDVEASHHRLSPDLKELKQDSTQGFEGYYNFAVTGSMDFTVDFQWTDSAFHNIEDAAILAFRLNARL